MKRWIGIAMLIVLVAALLVHCISQVGGLNTVFVFGIAALIVAWVTIMVFLLA